MNQEKNIISDQIDTKNKMNHTIWTFFQFLIVAFSLSLFVACGAGSGDLSTGEPLQDAIARFNMAIQSGDEAAAIELICQDERNLISEDGFSFTEKYRKGARRVRLSTLIQDNNLSLDSDGKIVGMLSALDKANFKGRYNKINKRAGLSIIEKEKKEELKELSAYPAQKVNTESVDNTPVAEALVEDTLAEEPPSVETSEAVTPEAKIPQVEMAEETPTGETPSRVESSTEAEAVESVASEAPNEAARAEVPQESVVEGDDGFVDE